MTGAIDVWRKIQKQSLQRFGHVMTNEEGPRIEEIVPDAVGGEKVEGVLKDKGDSARMMCCTVESGGGMSNNVPLHPFGLSLTTRDKTEKIYDNHH